MAPLAVALSGCASRSAGPVATREPSRLPETRPAADQTASSPSVPESPDSSPAPPADEQPASTAEAPADPATLFLERTDGELDAAVTLFEDGDREQAREEFSRILSELRAGDFPFPDYPPVADRYYAYLERIQTLEVAALLEPEEETFPGTDESTFDEIVRSHIFAIEVDPELGELVDEELRVGRFDIPMVVNKRVLQFLEYYRGPGREITELGLKRAGRYLDYFKEVFAREGLPLDLVYIPHVESLFQPTAYSRARARGIWQFMSGTAKLYGLHVGWWVDERSNVERSTVAAARHLKDLYEKFGDWYLVMAAYNAGAGRIERNLRRYGRLDYWSMVDRRLLPRETRHYVPAILASILIYKYPQTYGFSVEPDHPLEFETVSVDHQFDLRVIAEEIGIEAEKLEELNPELRRGITPYSDQPYALKVPPGTSELANQRIAEIPPEKRLRVRHHRVTRGDTLWEIARSYGTSLEAVIQANRLRNPNRLRLGQDLIIPLNPYSARQKPGSSEPTAGFYTVRRGDSLYAIARRFGLRVNRLAQLNNLGNGGLIYPGQRLRLR